MVLKGREGVLLPSTPLTFILHRVHSLPLSHIHPCLLACTMCCSVDCTAHKHTERDYDHVAPLHPYTHSPTISFFHPSCFVYFCILAFTVMDVVGTSLVSPFSFLFLPLFFNPKWASSLFRPSTLPIVFLYLPPISKLWRTLFFLSGGKKERQELSLDAWLDPIQPPGSQNKRKGRKIHPSTPPSSPMALLCFACERV